VTSKGSRIGVAIAIVALTVPIVALGVVFTGIISTPVATSEVASPGSDESGSDESGSDDGEPGKGAVIDNPLQGATFYVDPESLAAKAAAASAALDAAGSGSAPGETPGETPGATPGPTPGPTAAPSAETEVLQKLAATPAAIWLVPETSPIGTVGASVTATLDAAEAEGSTPVFVIYGVPNRDCGYLSAGGLTAADYPVWTAEIAGAFAERSAVVILEPDALALATQCGNADERVAQIKGAVDALAPTQAIVYLDGGHSTWLPATQMADLLNRAGIADVRGFATNVSNYNSTVKERAYGEKLSSLTGDSHYVIDTGRNGKGSSGEWCNPTGRALGAAPAVVTKAGNLDAQLWIKPPGESDGTCNGGPAAGAWWPQNALELAKGAGW
jgi:endoglucanase